MDYFHRAIPILLKSRNYICVFFEPMYHWSIGWFGVEKLTGYSADTLKMNYHELIGYLTNPLSGCIEDDRFSKFRTGITPLLRGKTSLLCEFCSTARIRAYQFLE